MNFFYVFQNSPCPNGAPPVCVDSQIKDPPDVPYPQYTDCHETAFGYYNTCPSAADLLTGGVLDVTQTSGVSCTSGAAAAPPTSCMCCQTQHRFKCYEGVGPANCP